MAYVDSVKQGWPTPDGLIQVENDGTAYSVAVEYKRINEGPHGILTAIGQVLSYIESGYAGAVVVVPNSYNMLDNAGEFAMGVLENTCKTSLAGVFSYDELDMSQTSPFDDKITLHRSLELDNAASSRPLDKRKTRTQWGFVREGETTPDTIAKWLETARVRSQSEFVINKNLRAAVQELCPTAEPSEYLSYSSGSEKHDKIWRTFWFKYVLTENMQKIWIKRGGEYVVGERNMELKQWNGHARTIFAGRSDSIKNKLVDRLNNGKITEKRAWEEFAENIHKRAHSFRETIDSGLEAFGLTGNDGEPTYLGDQFVRARKNNRQNLANTILQHALLKNGKYWALLHYIFKLSEEEFNKDVSSFSKDGKFLDGEYLRYLWRSLEEMHVLRRVSLRSGGTRSPLQAEKSILKELGLISGEMRSGVGIVINWPKVIDALEFDPQKIDLESDEQK